MSKHSNTRQIMWQATGDFVENAITHNIVLAQALGLCPIIAAGISLKNGVALTICTAIIMLVLGPIMAIIGDRISKWLRPVVYVILATLILAGVAWALESFVSPELYAQLYLFIPLMAVNLLYTRSVGKTGAVHPLAAVLNALGGTLGFGIVICAISALREIAINATIWDIPLGYDLVLPEAATPFAAFILLGFMSAFLQWVKHGITAYFRGKEVTVDE